MDLVGLIGGILGALVSLTVLGGVYVARIKDAETRGKFLQQFEQLKLDVDRHEGRIGVIVGAQEELERAYLEQSMLLKQLTDKITEIAADVKELVRGSHK